ncbi:LutC/YkgG family protein [Rhabdochromatium marinum]|uniref:LutC/YkgG family protein n=1 Tax=Rhabdochromatium marinum TaxID=48729 RepID=UPI001904BE73|nr:lactate utilization protein [Rhabdochromatium marinum]
MTNARTAILARLRSTPTGGDPRHTLPGDPMMADSDELLGQFCAALAAVHGEVYPVSADWPARIAAELSAAGLQRLWYGAAGPLATELHSGWPLTTQGATTVAELTPFDQTRESCREALFAGRNAGLTSALAGIAETGSLILWPTAAEPRSLSLIPEVHCVLLERRHIVPTLEHWMSGYCQRTDRPQLPTNWLMVTGPSKSADIEQTLTLGVHGPKRLLVFVRD